MRARYLLLAVVLVTATMAGCAKKQGSPDVNASDSASVQGQIDHLRIVEREVDGYGTCTFAVVEMDIAEGGGSGITLVGCDGESRR